MDNERFDIWVRGLGAGTSRRRVLAGLAGAAVGLFGLRRARADWTTDTWGGAVDFTGTFCGGIAGIACPPGYSCVDNPNDSCGPESGGADCGGICVKEGETDPCAAILCAAGSSCCNACGGVCVPIGTPCSEDLCGGESCNQTVCGYGEYCCNYSCSICAPIGGGCTQQFCGGEQCGDVVCPPGEVCCNASCGICTPPGGVCIQIACLD